MGREVENGIFIKVRKAKASLKYIGLMLGLQQHASLITSDPTLTVGNKCNLGSDIRMSDIRMESLPLNIMRDVLRIRVFIKSL